MRGIDARLIESQIGAHAERRPRRYQVLRPGFRREQEGLEVGFRRRPQPSPLVDGDEHGRLHPVPGHELRAFPDACIEERAESGFRLARLPIHDQDPFQAGTVHLSVRYSTMEGNLMILSPDSGRDALSALLSSILCSVDLHFIHVNVVN